VRNAEADYAEDAVHGEGFEGVVQVGEREVIVGEGDHWHADLVTGCGEMGPFCCGGCLEEGGVAGENDLYVFCLHDGTCMEHC